MPRSRRRRLLLSAAALVFLYFPVGYLAPRVHWIDARGVSTPVDIPAPTVSAVGALHVHTGRSHDAVGTESEAAAAARSAGLDFVIITDHPTASYADTLLREPARYVDGVLLIRGQEISLGSDVGRALVVGLDTVTGGWGNGLDAFATRLRRTGATAIVAHTRSPRTRDSWRPRRAPGFRGWEAFDLADAARARLKSPWVVYHVVDLLVGLAVGRAEGALVGLFRGSFRQPSVAAFDSIFSVDPLTALAGLDVHPKMRIFGRPFPPYGPFFRALTDHLTLGGPLPAAPRAAADSVLAALDRGRAFIAFGDDARSRRFVVTTRGPSLIAGFRNDPPARLLYRVVRDGVGAAWLRAGGILWPAGDAAAYRVEVYRYTFRIGHLYVNVRPWLFSSPIPPLDGEEAGPSVGPAD